MKSNMEQVYKNWMEVLAHWVTTMFNVGQGLAGEAFVQKLEEEFYQGGLQHGETLRSVLEVTGTDCIAVGRILDAVDESLGNYWDGYVENSPEGFEKHVTTCPVGEVFAGAPDICVRLVVSGMKGLAASTNPDVTVSMDKFICKGDKTCHYRIEARQSDRRASR